MMIAAALAAAGLLGSGAPAAADPGEDYELGWAVCQLLDRGWSTEAVVAELVAEFPPELIADEAAARQVLADATAQDCPGRR